jgi:CysZ protein
VIGDAFDAFAQIFSPPFRQVMLKTLAFAAALLVLAGFGLDRLALSLMHVAPGWLSALISVAVALGVIVGMILLAAPVASIVGSFFLDDIAALVEREIDPRGPPGRPIPLWPSTVMGLRFAVLSLLVSIVVLALTLLTGIGLFAFFFLNGYLLGREYFELAAMRHMTPQAARLLREEHRWETFIAGIIVAAFVAVPVLNLVTPLFATALMTRIYKRAAAAT